MLSSHFKIVATTQYRLKMLNIRQDILVWVQSGEKHLISSLNEQTLSCQAGELLLIAKGTVWEVINDPADSSPYLASVVMFSEQILTQASNHYSIPAFSMITTAHCYPNDTQLQEAILRLSPQIAGHCSPILQEHRTLELLFLLAERGLMFQPYHALSWNEKIHRLISANPSKTWSAQQVAQHFNLSESSLRRKLKPENLTIATLIRDIKLEIALNMLQTDKYSIGEVATYCGWESHSRFSEIFFERWGVLPSVIKSGKNL